MRRPSPAEHLALQANLRLRFNVGNGGPVSYAARANAVSGQVTAK
jgi:hypothetical protein